MLNVILDFVSIWIIFGLISLMIVILVVAQRFMNGHIEKRISKEKEEDISSILLVGSILFAIFCWPFTLKIILIDDTNDSF